MLWPDSLCAPSVGMRGLKHPPHQGARLLHAIRETLPESTVLAGSEIDRGTGVLFAAEEAPARMMSARRRREFAAGRHYARAALRGLGLGPAAIPVRPTRDPVWPAGIVGAISHSREICAAVVARRSRLAALGLDIEGAEPLPDALVELVCRPPECRDRAALERETGVDLPKLVFVLKEAFYKAYFPATASFLEFTDVEVALDPSRGVFEAHLVGSDKPACFGHRAFGGRFGRWGNMVFAATWLTAAEAAA